MSDVSSPPLGPIWMTYRELAGALGLRTPEAAAARARRARWPKRFRNDTGEAEIEVPAEALAQGRQRPKERRPPPPEPDVACDLTPAVQAAVAPLQATIEMLLTDLKVARAAIDDLRVEAAAHQVDAAEQRGAAIAKDAQIADLKAAHQREIQDRRAVEQQMDRVRLELRVAEERLLKAKQHQLQQQVDRLQRERLVPQETAEKKRPWWGRR